jgi:hypothetical protein
MADIQAARMSPVLAAIAIITVATLLRCQWRIGVALGAGRDRGETEPDTAAKGTEAAAEA